MVSSPLDSVYIIVRPLRSLDRIRTIYRFFSHDILLLRNPLPTEPPGEVLSA